MIELLHGDCLDLMPSIPDGSVDMILADLPYGTTACKWDTIIPLEPLWKEYKRIIKRNGAIVLTASQPFTTDLINSNRAWFRYSWAWDKVKPNGMGYAKYQPMRVVEDVIVFAQSTPPYNPQRVKRDVPRKYRNYSQSDTNNVTLGAMDADKVTDFLYPRNLLTFSNANQHNKAHPTQKPVALMEYLIRTYTNEGETVLDNTMGSGTTLVACVNTGRNGIGIEKDADYFAIACERVREAQEAAKQLVMEMEA